MIPIATVLLVLVVLAGILAVVELIANSNKPVAQPSMGTDGTVVVSVPVYEDRVAIIGGAAKAIVENQDFSIPVHVVLQNYASDKSRLDICQTVRLSFHVVNQPKNYTVDKVLVELAENREFQNAKVHTLGSTEKTLELYNLKADTQYYYRIRVCFTNSVETWAGGSFVTEASPRILSIGGIRNVRDIGGWKAADGKTIRQGLLYRGTELDGANDEFKLTEEGRQFMLEELKIRTDMDLRWSDEIPVGIHALGDSVAHIYYGTPQYTGVFLDSGKETIRRIFSDLADKDNYPIYLHCIYGRDRTGTVCALLEALLGVSKEDIRRDYQLSALHNRNIDSAFDGFLTQLDTYEGQTIQDKTENYLLSIGVTEEEIASIREIFLG